MTRALFVLLALLAGLWAAAKARRQYRQGAGVQVRSAVYLAAVCTMMALWGPAVGAYS